MKKFDAEIAWWEAQVKRNDACGNKELAMICWSLATGLKLGREYTREAYARKRPKDRAERA
jgi:hypothetical protein